MLLRLTLMHFVLHLYWWLQDLVTDFRWRIGADLMHGKLSLPSEFSVLNSATLLSAAPTTSAMASTASAASVEAPSAPFVAPAATSAFLADLPDFTTELFESEHELDALSEINCGHNEEDDDFQPDPFVFGHALGSLASKRENIREEMFKNIKIFRENPKNGVRKVGQLKTQFQHTFLELTCTGYVDADATMKKKCGKFWACIEYAIFEFVDISSFSCSHVERMRVKHQEWLLSQKRKIENLREVSVFEEKDTLLLQRPVDAQVSESVFEEKTTLLLQRPVDAPDPQAPIRKSGRPVVKPARSSGSDKGKKQNDVKIDNVDSCLETFLRSRNRKRKRPTESKVTRSETRYPAMSQAEKNEVVVGSAASYQDFVDIFCKTMWDDPRIDVIEQNLKVLFRGHQAKYGTKIVPDIQLEKLLERAESLPTDWDRSDESKLFVEKINSLGWYKIENVVVKHELMIVAIMSLSVFNFSTIKNRHGWSAATEKKQNRCVFLFSELMLV